ncbi:ANTAR domain-containing protein [Streptomyces sp. NPDC047108]|uniref:ANTAR domain-containing protein n=1 Tax=Streptomyces sp. NPDC047108 TaxID=3155025 RepID=UPI0033EA81CC
MTDGTELKEKVTDLQEEVDHLRQALVSHAVIDQAIGVLIAKTGLRSDEGWEVLKEVSQHTNIKLREIACHVVRWTQNGRLPEDIRTRLHTAVIDARRARGESASASGRGHGSDEPGDRTGRCETATRAAPWYGPASSYRRCRGATG